MTSVSRYLEKHALYGALVPDPPAPGLHSIVVIPCYDEENLLITLESLSACTPPPRPAEVLVVVNEGASADGEIKQRNDRTYQEALAWSERHPGLNLHMIRASGLHDRHAGVGLARKIGMDEAARRFMAAGEDGAIICLDADCTVDPGYLLEIERLFTAHPKASGCSIYFEHPLEGDTFDAGAYRGIVEYELFLRYYKNALAYCGFPYPFHTVGSSMAVRCNAYCKQGGMNRRQAGEDFYFLHKIFLLGNFHELNTTRVIPSPRPSHRVPFGTGRAIQNFLDSGERDYTTYDPRTFSNLKLLFDAVPGLYSPSGDGMHWPAPVTAFLATQDFENKLREIREHSASEKAFVKRFFGWFDGFMVLKYVHHTRSTFSEIPVLDAVSKFSQIACWPVNVNWKAKEYLTWYRELDKKPSRKL